MLAHRSATTYTSAGPAEIVIARTFGPVWRVESAPALSIRDWTADCPSVGFFEATFDGTKSSMASEERLVGRRHEDQMLGSIICPLLDGLMKPRTLAKLSPCIKIGTEMRLAAVKPLVVKGSTSSSSTMEVSLKAEAKIKKTSPFCLGSATCPTLTERTKSASRPTVLVASADVIDMIKAFAFLISPLISSP